MGWRPEYTHALRGRRVTVLADNDTPGLRHAECVVGSLVAGGAASVRLVARLPEAGEKHDVLDFLALGKSKADLVAAILEWPEYQLRQNPDGHGDE
jgi:hypothetical protein